jgi:hypothetical protein
VAYAFEREWATALERLGHSMEIGSEKKQEYVERYGKILENFKKRQTAKSGRT